MLECKIFFVDKKIRMNPKLNCEGCLQEKALILD